MAAPTITQRIHTPPPPPLDPAVLRRHLDTYDQVAYIRSDGVALVQDGPHRYAGCCPFHNEATASFKVWVEGSRGWYCFGCGRGGSILDYVIDRAGGDRTDRAARAQGLAALGLGTGRRLVLPKLPARLSQAPKTAKLRLPTRDADQAFDYTDAAGILAYQVQRWDLTAAEQETYGKRKLFVQRRPDPAAPGRWLYNLDGVTPVLFRLPALLAAPLDAPVWIVEGEKAALALLAADPTAIVTTNSSGQGNWPDAQSVHLAGRTCYLLPDNNAVGVTHMETVAWSLAKAGAACVTIIPLPGLPAGGDVADFLAAGHTVDALQVLAAFVAPQPSLDAATGELLDDAAPVAAADLVAEVAALRLEVGDLRDQVAGFGASMDAFDRLLTHPDLNIADRAGLLGLQRLIDWEFLTVGGSIETTKPEIAKKLRVSDATVGRQLDKWEELGLVRHTPTKPISVPITDPATGKTRMELRSRLIVACDHAPVEAVIVVKPATPVTKIKKQGGARETNPPCPHCGADGTDQEEMRRCRKCKRTYTPRFAATISAAEAAQGTDDVVVTPVVVAPAPAPVAVVVPPPALVVTSAPAAPAPRPRVATATPGPLAAERAAKATQAAFAAGVLALIAGTGLPAWNASTRTAGWDVDMPAGSLTSVTVTERAPPGAAPDPARMKLYQTALHTAGLRVKPGPPGTWIVFPRPGGPSEEDHVDE